MAAGAFGATITPINGGAALNTFWYGAAFVFGATGARLSVACAQFMEHLTRTASGFPRAFVALATAFVAPWFLPSHELKTGYLFAIFGAIRRFRPFNRRAWHRVRAEICN